MPIASEFVLMPIERVAIAAVLSPACASIMFAWLFLSLKSSATYPVPVALEATAMSRD
jgi:hypothetical protein